MAKLQYSACNTHASCSRNPIVGSSRKTRHVEILARWSLIILFAIAGDTSWGQTTYTWTGGASGGWTTPTNWSPERISPSPGDVLVLAASSIITPDFDASQTISGLHLTNNSRVVFTNDAPRTITINDGSSADFQIDTGSALVDSSDYAITIALAPGATGSVSGAFVVKGVSAAAAHRLTATDANSLTFHGGSLCKIDTLFAGNLFGTAGLNSVIFEKGSVYAQKSGSNPFGAAQPNSVVVFQAGSLFRSEGNINLSFAGRTYADFEYSASGSATVNGSTAVSIDDLTITAGILNFNTTGTGTSVRGDIFVADGAALNFNPASSGTVNLNGLHEQTVGGSGTINAGANSTLMVSNASGVRLQRDISTDGALVVNGVGILDCGVNIVSGSGSFSLASGGTLRIGSPEGITQSGASGNIQVSGARSFNSAGNYMYTGSGPQHTGDGLPSIVNNLEIKNGAGVSLDGNPTVTGRLALAGGNLVTGCNVLTLGTDAAVDESGGVVIGNLATSRDVSANNAICEFGGMGLAIATQAAGNVPGPTQLKRVTGTALKSGQSSSIGRYFELSPANNSALNANLIFHYRDDELDGQNEPALRLFRAATAGGPWSAVGGVVDTDMNTISVNGINSFSIWTAADDDNDLTTPSSLSGLELFIVSDSVAADSAHAVAFPCAGMSCGTVYGEDDWCYDSPVLTFYIVPVGSQSVCAAEFDVNWDASNATLSVVKGNVFDFFAVQDIAAGKKRINAGAGSNLNESPSPGKYLARLEFTIVRPGFNEITITGADIRYFDGEVQQNIPVAAHAGTIKFYLGDFASPSNVTAHGDGKMNFEDLVQFALSYFGESDGEPPGYKAKFDVGPTNSLRSYFAMPNPDGRIQFEDLAVFSIGYGKSATRQLPKKSESSIVVRALQPSINAEGVIAVPLAISGAVKDLRALSVALTYPSSSLKYLKCEKSGETDREYCFMAAKAEGATVTLDAAIVGAEHEGLAKDGTFALVFFKQRDQSKSYDIGIHSVKARDSDNQDLSVLTEADWTSVADVPAAFALFQNYPNPFNAKAVIGYQLPVTSRLTLKAYDILGREAATLVDGTMQAGSYAAAFDGARLASGVYILRLCAAPEDGSRPLVLVRKMLLMK
jgi:hypothetical protein